MAQFPTEQSQDGQFVRQQDAFNHWVSADGQSGFKAEPGRYHLYVSWACPWAHRTIITRRLMGLEDAIGMTAVDPVRDERGWAFRAGDGFSLDALNGFAFLSEAYKATDPAFEGRYTVPALWDTQTRRIVSNNDDDLMRMFVTEFAAVAAHPVDLYPMAQRDEIDELNAWVYQEINNGVYRAGFSTSQASYERAVTRLFNALDVLEQRLSTRRYLFGAQPVETDWRLFVTLIRFDAVYVGHFKCNLRRIDDYPALGGYMRDLYQLPGIAETVKIDQIKRHYYYTHDDINPTRIVPVGPELHFERPHDRARLS